jgi:hypothetical protein
MSGRTGVWQHGPSGFSFALVRMLSQRLAFVLPPCLGRDVQLTSSDSKATDWDRPRNRGRCPGRAMALAPTTPKITPADPSAPGMTTANCQLPTANSQQALAEILRLSIVPGKFGILVDKRSLERPSGLQCGRKNRLNGRGESIAD